MNKNWIRFKTLEEYYEFFEKIPESKWCELAYYHGGRMCAVGHLTGGDGDLTAKAGLSRHPLRDVFGEASNVTTPFSQWVLTDINDGDEFYRELGDTPKERILNALILKISGVWDELFD